MSENLGISGSPKGYSLSHSPDGPRCGECKHWVLRSDTRGRYGGCRWFWPGLLQHDNPACNGFECRTQG